MYAKRKTVMPDTITMINLVWSAMIAVMMTATFTLYQGKPDSPQYNYTQMTGQYLEQPYY